GVGPSPAGGRGLCTLRPAEDVHERSLVQEDAEAQHPSLGATRIAGGGAERVQDLVALGEQAQGGTVVALLAPLAGAAQQGREGGLQLSGLMEMAAETLGDAALAALLPAREVGGAGVVVREPPSGFAGEAFEALA